jgi:site-specific DNA-methyltransferase (adenine-specific)
MPDLLTVPITQLRLSRFNARRQRPDSQVTRLADRMQRNGFEVSRALWAYQVNGHYEVFAGGTRLAAARAAALEEVPILLYPADDTERISRLADEDNENDEYHVPVPLPDIWAEYQRLKDKEGWTQEVIAKAKHTDQSVVSDRIKYATFPSEVLGAFMETPVLKETHAAELAKLWNFHKSKAWIPFRSWLTRDQALEEIVATVLDKHRGSSAEKAPTATVFRTHVKTYNEMVEEANKALATFPAAFKTLAGTQHNPATAFLAQLAAKKIRTAKDVMLMAARQLAECHALQRQIQEHHTREAQEAEAEQARLEAEQARQAYRNRLLSCLHQGDCRHLLPHCPVGIHLVLTDPPYGVGFQSKRRVTSARKPLIEGDTPEDALSLFRETLALLKPKLAADAHLFCFTHQDTYCAFRQAFMDAGLTVRRTLTWDKGTHGLGDTTRGEVLTQTEWIIHAVQGNPKFEDDQERPEILTFAGEQDSELPTEKPLDLLTHLIRLASPPGALVVDPFAGSGHTLLAALALGREGWACEYDPDTYAIAARRLYAYVERSLGKVRM